MCGLTSCLQMYSAHCQQCILAFTRLQLREAADAMCTAVACSALAKDLGGKLSREHVTDALRAAGIGGNGEVTELLWTEMGLAQNAPITKVAS